MPAKSKKVTKSDFIRVRVEPKLKEKAENIIYKLGLSPTDAITLYYQQIQMNNGIPFEVRIPNQETLDAIEESKDPKHLIHSKDAKDMFSKLGI